MKARIIKHKNPLYINMVCDVVYYSFEEKTSKIVFRTYNQGMYVELPFDTVRIIYENQEEREKLEHYILEKSFKQL